MLKWSGVAESGRVGVLGGTFDPVHIGHLVLAETAREQLALQSVLFVPAGEPWRKADRAVTSANDRLAMTRLAVEENPSFAVSTVEVDRDGPSYTVDTLRALKADHGGCDLVLILGEDALADLPSWKEPVGIVEQATLAVARRRQAGGELPPSVGALQPRVEWLLMPRLEVSASEIRRRVAQGMSIRYLVPPSVEAYIGEHGLYRA